MSEDSLNYLSGFGSHFESEAVKGALPVGRNSPQRHSMGLYPEQISGTAFTVPREQNLKSWLYRTQPAAVTGHFELLDSHPLHTRLEQDFVAQPNPLRWSPYVPAEYGPDFFAGLVPMVEAGAQSQSGVMAYMYAIEGYEKQKFYYTADGELLFIPFDGSLELRTEFGVLQIEPLEIAVIPRGVRFQVVPLKGKARGYLAENYGVPFRLPQLGPIGANGLAAPRDFLYPHAKFETEKGDFEILAKFEGQVFRARQDHHPLNVVAWHGNLAPYKYDLRKFNTIGTVSFDHPDPSIFTVLTSPSTIPGVADIDFVIFPPRWMVGEDTFRPPYFHRNYMNEFMGLITGVYDAKAEGFLPGGASLHNRMTGHGPDAQTFEAASKADLKPEKIDGTMAFMLETREVLYVAEETLGSDRLDKTYAECWKGLKNLFKP
jgi:homogentisate 1,2-dioxygenase